jgi:hypothetical protein
LSYGIKTRDGTAAAPAWRFANDTDTGFYRIGADNLGIAVGGAKVVDMGATGVSVTGTFTSSGAVTGGTYNGQTISSAASLTGSLTVANGLTVSAGTTAVQALTTTVATSKLISSAEQTASGITDFSVGGAAWFFSRPNDGVAAHSIFAYNTAASSFNFAISVRGALVLATGGAGSTGTEKARLTEAGILAVGTTATTGASVGGIKVAGGSQFDSTLAVTGNTTLSGALGIKDGTVSSLGLWFSSDTDTGLYRHATDRMGIAAGGVARVLIDGAGLADETALAIWVNAGVASNRRVSVGAADSGGTGFRMLVVPN